MNLFDHSRVYLCGQVESDASCADWRKTMAKDLYIINPTIKVWDPIIKPDWMSEDTKDISLMLNKDLAYSQTDFNAKRCWDGNMEIRSVCQKLLMTCDWVIARILNKFTWGSIDELEIAISRKIPIFFLFPDGPIGVYGVTSAMPLMHRKHYIHTTPFNLLHTIGCIDNGSIDLTKEDPLRWVGFGTYPNAASI